MNMENEILEKKYLVAHFYSAIICQNVRDQP
ncbi:MAG: hypothetical protein ACJA17_000885 [Polaribacter sp.]|jgi:hypothetical protein